MNENIDLTKILKNCPKGAKLYSIIYGEVEFDGIEEGCTFSITFVTKNGGKSTVTSGGKHYNYCDGDCTLFPSKDQRDWSKFTAPWYKKGKFSPKTLKPFDRVLCKNGLDIWHCEFFSSYTEKYICPNVCIGGSYSYCIPYNEETKHIVNTTDEPSDYYRYWED